MKLKIILPILLLFFFTSCSKYWYKPYGRIFNDMPKGGSPGFNLGWQHGCESGFATQFGGSLYMMFYSWKKDPDIMSLNPDLEKIRLRYKGQLNIDWNNPDEINKNLGDYKKIHSIAYNYCRHSLIGLLQTAGMAPPIAGEERWNPGASDIGNVYKIDGRGDMRWSLW